MKFNSIFAIEVYGSDSACEKIRELVYHKNQETPNPFVLNAAPYSFLTEEKISIEDSRFMISKHKTGISFTFDAVLCRPDTQEEESFECPVKIEHEFTDDETYTLEEVSHDYNVDICVAIYGGEQSISVDVIRIHEGKASDIQCIQYSGMPGGLVDETSKSAWIGIKPFKGIKIKKIKSSSFLEDFAITSFYHDNPHSDMIRLSKNITTFICEQDEIPEKIKKCEVFCDLDHYEPEDKTSSKHPSEIRIESDTFIENCVSYKHIETFEPKFRYKDSLMISSESETIFKEFSFGSEYIVYVNETLRELFVLIKRPYSHKALTENNRDEKAFPEFGKTEEYLNTYFDTIMEKNHKRWEMPNTERKS